MITKERLKELIQQRATVYANGIGEIELIPENDIEIYENGNDSYILYAFEPNRKYKNEIFAEELFKTKEEAEEYLTYGNITRTEKFPYVSWEELNKDFQEFKNGTYTIVECKYIFSLNIKVNKPAISQILLITEYENYNWNYSKENWFKALDLCVKLWKGEK